MKTWIWPHPIPHWQHALRNSGHIKGTQEALLSRRREETTVAAISTLTETPAGVLPRNPLQAWLTDPERESPPGYFIWVINCTLFYVSKKSSFTVNRGLEKNKNKNSNPMMSLVAMSGICFRKAICRYQVLIFNFIRNTAFFFICCWISKKGVALI